MEAQCVVSVCAVGNTLRLLYAGSEMIQLQMFV